MNESTMIQIEKIYKEIQPNIYAYFYAKTSQKTVAEDLTHDVFYAACKNMTSFAGYSSLTTWLFGIAKNILHKYYRSKNYQRQLQETLLKEQEMAQNRQETPEETTIKKEDIQTLLGLIQQLTEIEQDIVMMRIFGNLTFKQIGELIHKTENYTRVTFHRLKVKLQKEMRRMYD